MKIVCVGWGGAGVASVSACGCILPAAVIHLPRPAAALNWSALQVGAARVPRFERG